MAARIGRLSEKMIEFEIPEDQDMSVDEVVRKYYPDAADGGYEARLNGEPVEGDELVRDGDTVTIFSAIRAAS